MFDFPTTPDEIKAYEALKKVAPPDHWLLKLAKEGPVEKIIELFWVQDESGDLRSVDADPDLVLDVARTNMAVRMVHEANL